MARRRVAGARARQETVPLAACRYALLFGQLRESSRRIHDACVEVDLAKGASRRSSEDLGRVVGDLIGLTSESRLARRDASPALLYEVAERFGPRRTNSRDLLREVVGRLGARSREDARQLARLRGKLTEIAADFAVLVAEMMVWLRGDTTVRLLRHCYRNIIDVGKTDARCFADEWLRLDETGAAAMVVPGRARSSADSDHSSGDRRASDVAESLRAFEQLRSGSVFGKEDDRD